MVFIVKKQKTKLKNIPKNKDFKYKISIAKKKNKNLPIYLIEVNKNNTLIGYRVVNHPNKKEKRFISKNLDYNYKRAIEYLNE